MNKCVNQFNVLSVTKNGFEYFFSLLIVLDCNTVYFVAEDTNELFRGLVYFLGIALSFISLREIMKKHVIYFLLAIIMYNLIFCVFNVEETSVAAYGLKFILFLPAMFMYYSLVCASDLFNVFHKIKYIVCIISGISLLCYFFCSVFKIMNFSDSVAINWDGIRNIPSFYGIYFETQGARWLEDLLSDITIRNTGVFVEGPMYACMLLFALLDEVFLESNTNICRVMLIVITIITTFSTTAYVCAIVFAFVLFWYRIKGRISLGLKIIMGMLLTVSVAVVSYFLLYLKAMQGDSFYIRVMDYVEGFSVWQDNFLLGVGYGNLESVVSIMNFRGNSNVIIPVLMIGGVYFGLVYLLPVLILLFLCFKENDIRLVSLLVFCTVIYLTTLIPFNAFLINFIAFVLAIPFRDDRKIVC